MIILKRTIFLAIVLIIFYSPINISARQVSFPRFIPSNTFAYINISNKKTIEDYSFSTTFIFPFFSGYTKKIINEFEIKSDSYLSLIYISPTSILSNPVILAKVNSAKAFLNNINRFYKTEKIAYGQNTIFSAKNPNSKQGNIFYFTFIDNYIILGSNQSEIKKIIDTFSGKIQNFSTISVYEEIEKSIKEEQASLRFYINIELLLRNYELLLKPLVNITIQSVLNRGGGFTAQEIKDISNANTDEIFIYLSQVSYLAGDYNDLNKKLKFLIKFSKQSPLASLTKIAPEKIKNFNYLPDDNVILAWSTLENNETRSKYYNYALEKIIRFDSSRVYLKKFLKQFDVESRVFGSHEIWAWVHGPEGMTWVDIVEFKEKNITAGIKNRFNGLKVFFKSDQNFKFIPDKSVNFKDVIIKSEKISFSPLSFNVAELMGYNAKQEYFTAWYCNIDNNLIMSIENEPNVIKQIIVAAKKEKKSLMANRIQDSIKNSKNNSVIYFSPQIINYYLNYSVSQDNDKNDSTLRGKILNSIQFFNNILKSPQVIGIAQSLEDGFYYEFIIEKSKPH